MGVGAVEGAGIVGWVAGFFGVVMGPVIGLSGILQWRCWRAGSPRSNRMEDMLEIVRGCGKGPSIRRFLRGTCEWAEIGPFFGAARELAECGMLDVHE
jgi:hypothetical protein